jgi:hypothetical protein
MARLADICKQVFQYPLQVHVRRHGPKGYVNYQSYKPWLRDEFHFRCLYCLWRERWLPVGEDAFGVDHLLARATAPQRTTDYENLVYACCRCNSMKTDALCVLDPCEQAYGQHLEVFPDGTIRGMTRQGAELIEICKLNQPRIVQARKQLLDLFQMLQEAGTSQAISLLHQHLGFPDNLPVLSQHRPPDGNCRPAGLARAYHLLRELGQLPSIY